MRSLIRRFSTTNALQNAGNNLASLIDFESPNQKNFVGTLQNVISGTVKISDIPVNERTLLNQSGNPEQATDITLENDNVTGGNPRLALFFNTSCEDGLLGYKKTLGKILEQGRHKISYENRASVGFAAIYFPLGSTKKQTDLIVRPPSEIAPYTR